MANIYVTSVDGNDADDGSTRALAKATMAGAAAIDAAGNNIFVDTAHAESGASSSCAWAGTNANPVKVISNDWAAEPPTVVSAGADVTVTGTTFSWTGAVDTYGVNWIFSSGSSFGIVFNGSDGINQYFESCKFFITGTGTSSSLGFGSALASNDNLTRLRNCQFKFGATGQSIAVRRDLIIEGGSWASGGTNPTGVFTIGSGNRAGSLRVIGFDFSNLSSTVNLIKSIGEGGCDAVFIGCKLPASWSGSLIASGQEALGSRAEMWNCDDGDTNYKVKIQDYQGTIDTETTLVKTGGSSDGTTPISFKMVTTANVSYPGGPFQSHWIPSKYNETTGSAVTLTVDILHDSATNLQDDEVWVEVAYAGTSGFPLYSIATDIAATFLTTAADQDASTTTWTTTGMTNPNKQKLAVTFTPQEKGAFMWRVCSAKPSYTLYFDGVGQIS